MQYIYPALTCIETLFTSKKARKDEAAACMRPHRTFQNQQLFINSEGRSASHLSCIWHTYRGDSLALC